MAKKSSTDLVPAFDNPVLLQDPGTLQGIINDNLGLDAQLTVSDLDRIRIEQSSFMVPTLEGEVPEQEVLGVVLLSKQSRAYWPSKDATGDPPTCFSDDGITGHGNPGGSCSACPLAQFGSAPLYVDGVAEGNNAQACKASTMVFILTEDGFLPKLLQLPPTSLRKMKSYAVALTGRLLSVRDVVTRFTIDKAKNSAGQVYPVVVPKFAARLDEETKAKVHRLAEVYMPRLQTVRIMSDQDLSVDAETISEE